MEIADKLRQLFVLVPESFLPYPAEILVEALNVAAKDKFDEGNIKAAKAIETTAAAYLSSYLTEKITDETALESMNRSLSLILSDPELKKIKLEKLREVRDNWAKIRARDEHVEDDIN